MQKHSILDYLITVGDTTRNEEYSDLFSSTNVHDAVDMALQYYSLQLGISEEKIKIKSIQTINDYDEPFKTTNIHFHV